MTGWVEGEALFREEADQAGLRHLNGVLVDAPLRVVLGELTSGPLKVRGQLRTLLWLALLSQTTNPPLDRRASPCARGRPAD